MSSHRLVLCLVLLTASVGFAQVPADAPLAGSTEEEAPPPPPPPTGELIPYNARPPPVPAPDLILPRILSEAFGGVLGGVGMGIVGLLVGASALESVDCSSGGEVCAATVLIVTIPAAFVGIPLGVQIAGESMGGQGRFLPALAGTILGTAAGFAYGSTQDGSGDLALGLIVGPILGAIVGYEISNAVMRDSLPVARTTSSGQGGFQMTPVAGTTPRGGFLGGLAGRF